MGIIFLVMSIKWIDICRVYVVCIEIVVIIFVLIINFVGFYLEGLGFKVYVDIDVFVCIFYVKIVYYFNRIYIFFFEYWKLFFDYLEYIIYVLWK